MLGSDLKTIWAVFILLTQAFQSDTLFVGDLSMLNKEQKLAILSAKTDFMDLDKKGRQQMKKVLANTLTVKDLIESLKDMPQDLPVELRIMDSKAPDGSSYSVASAFLIEAIRCGGDYNSCELAAAVPEMLDYYANENDLEMLEE
jgi:hypothetical protein